MKIILISMDCVRPDYLNKQPFKEIKKESTWFSTCITTASHTSTSHSSILTGYYPFNHNVRWIINYSVKKPMVQEILKKHSFKTGAFIGGFPLTQGDLNRGFDAFQYDPRINDQHEGRSTYVPANILAQQVIDYLEKNEKSNVFIFIHFFDCHLTLRSEFDLNIKPPKKDKSGRYIDVEKYLGRRERRYIEEIYFIGSQIKRLIELVPIDLLVITSDHGDKMQGEHNYPWVYNSRGEIVGSHFHEVELYDVQLRVPLIFWGNGIENRRINTMVRTIDITPTILDYVGRKIYRNQKFDGLSLKPYFNSKKEIKPKFAYSETYFAQLHKNNIHTIEMNKKYQFGWKNIDNLISIRNNKWKLICTANKTIEPYKLFKVNDNEKLNLLKEKPKIVKKYYCILKKIIENDNQYKINYIETDKIQKAIKKMNLKNRR